jgi:hypothetical protein
VEAEVGFGGWRMGPEVHQPLRPLGGFVFLRHAPNVTLSEVQLVGARLGSVIGEPSGIGSLGARLLAPRP